MKKSHFFIAIMMAALVGALVAVGSIGYLQKDGSAVAAEANPELSFTKYSFENQKTIVPEGLNFVYAAKAVTPGVVHIKTKYSAKTSGNQYRGNSPFDFFEEYLRNGPGGQQKAPRQGQGSGSGVIISEDGYIVTNNHVIDKADEIEVLLNDNRSIKGKVIGTDPTTDLALIKIEAEDLITIKYGNSDDLEIGEWVLAVGNPYEFRSTVTAGIVSAKARNINILRNKTTSGIESFIQTDAAVNPGNSGGALVNLRGELVGINTAIASPTGSFAGYSFAVPVSLVEKVVEDLKTYGVVQRALLGIFIKDVTAELAEEEGISVLNGVYIEKVGENSAADDANLEAGDVITKVEGEKVSTVSELQEKIAVKRPGDHVSITYLRDGKLKEVEVVLKNKMKTTAVVEASNKVSFNGATFVDLTPNDKKKYEIDGGVKIEELKNGTWKSAGVVKDFIVTHVDKRPVKDVQELIAILNNASDGILVKGIKPDGSEGYYGIGW